MRHPPAEFHLVQAEEDLTRLLDDYLAAEVLAIDIETSGLDPHTDQRLLQDHHLAGLTVVSRLRPQARL